RPLGPPTWPRDPSKRAPLGEVSARLADHAVFTEEDHRDTPLADILAEMERGARGPGTTTSIGDRRAAIRHAVGQARPGDTVVLAGKGPEDTLERDTETIPWDEVDEARQALRLRHP
ncbi:glutamate ligase domain-containing protein, partial [Pseudactinotalea suaedae]